MKAFDLKAETRTALHDLADQGEVRPEDCMRVVVQLVSAVKSQLDGGLREWLASTIEHPSGLRALLDDGLTPSRIHTARSAMRAGRVTPKKEHCE